MALTAQKIPAPIAITDVKALDFAGMLTWMEARRHGVVYYNSLTYSTGAKGPSFGPLHFDLATNSAAQATLSLILEAAGLCQATTDVILAAAKGISTIITDTPKAKEYYFATQLGDGNLSTGSSRLAQIYTLLAQNADYINAAASAYADDIAWHINDYLSTIAFTGTLSTNAVCLLAELVHHTGSLDWMKQIHMAEKITGPTTVRDIKSAVKTACKTSAFAFWADGHYEMEIPTDLNPRLSAWYIASEHRFPCGPICPAHLDISSLKIMDNPTDNSELLVLNLS